MNTQKPIIEIKHLNVTYFPGKSNEVRALKDINLEIYPGEFIIFFGPSGCGKSTLLYSISGLEGNIAGDIVIKGDNLRTLSGKPREEFHQKTIGMVFQAYYLIPSLTVLQNVALPRMALNSSIAEREERGLALLKQFGVYEQAKKLPTELSGGQQQRVAICRSVMNDPNIILADEPVGNLDSKSSEDVMLLLRELNDKDKKTVVLVTHDPSHLHNAHRVFYIRDGAVVRVQENSAQDRKQSPVAAARQQSNINADLEEWAKTLGPDALGSSQAITDLKRSRELLTEVFTGMSVKEMTLLEGLVQKMLEKKTLGHELFAMLHGKQENGGLAFSKIKAQHWTKQVASIVSEVRRIERASKKSKGSVYDALFLQAREMRHYAVRQRHPAIREHWKLLALDQTISERLKHVLDPEAFRKKLSQSLKKGGAGMTAASARTFAKQIEQLIALHGESPEKQRPDTADGKVGTQKKGDTDTAAKKSPPTPSP